MAVASHLFHEVRISREGSSQVPLYLRLSIVICLLRAQLLVLFLQFSVVLDDVSLEFLSRMRLQVPRVCFLAEHRVPAVLTATANTLMLFIGELNLLLHVYRLWLRWSESLLWASLFRVTLCWWLLLMRRGIGLRVWRFPKCVEYAPQIVENARAILLLAKWVRRFLWRATVVRF